MSSEHPPDLPFVHVAPSLTHRLVDGQATIPTTTTEPEYYGSAHRAEARYSLPASAYFYAGRACSDFGTFAIAFAKEAILSIRGTTNPFDTGGLMLGHMVPPEEESDTDYVRRTLKPIDGWDSYFALYVAEHFSDVTCYLCDKPSNPSAFHLRNQHNWRAWTYEVRPEGDVAVLDAEKWSGAEHEVDWLILQVCKDSYSYFSNRDRFVAFLDRGLPSPTPCVSLNEWIRQRL